MRKRLGTREGTSERGILSVMVVGFPLPSGFVYFGLFLFLSKGSLCGPGWPRIHSQDYSLHSL